MSKKKHLKKEASKDTEIKSEIEDSQIEVEDSQIVEKENTKKEKDGDKSDAKKNKNAKSKKKTNSPEKRTLGQKTKATVSELKKVTWPTFGQTVKQTGVVLAFVLLFVIILLGLNSLFGWLFDLIVNIK